MTVAECVTTEVVTIAPEASAKEAFTLMKSLGIRHLVVVRNGVIVGIVTDRDLRRPKIAEVFKSWNDFYRVSDEFEVEDIMSSPVTTVSETTDVREAARIMVERRIGALPITTPQGKLAGIITESDVLRAFIAAPSASARKTRKK